jgi:thiazole/oxazole-forming peptide maturase SagD family component
MTAWYTSPYTGLFRSFGPLAPRPHDPELALCSGVPAPWAEGVGTLEASGIGLDSKAAEGACVGEAVERLQPYPLPDDQLVEASYASWPLAEPAVPPEQWVLFHPEQYAAADFPFRPFTRSSVCAWVCCRRMGSGEPWWVPADLAYLFPRPGERHQICPGVSTGLACGRGGDPVVLRGLQEVIERDAVLGAWWGRYPLCEFSCDDVLDALGSDWCYRLLRPNLRYRCFRIDSPFSSHVTVATIAGEDREGFCFSVGSACRETRAESWRKSLLEAVHGRHYVRHLKGDCRPLAPREESLSRSERPTSFAEHAVYYSVHPERLACTIFGGAGERETQAGGEKEELPALQERLGKDRLVLFRSMTPPALAQEGLDWHVVRVLVPGMQPLHGDHRLAHLGGPLWAPRTVADWAAAPPHPFP